MNSKELLQAANEAQPETMKKVAAMMFLAEKLDPEFAKEWAESAAAVIKRAVDGMEKLSNAPPQHMGPWGSVGVIGAGAIAAGLGTSLASDLYDMAKRGLSATRNFKSILKANPILEQRHDKADLRKAFNVVHRYGPEFTADPVVGGHLIATVATSPDTSWMLMKDLTSNRKNIIEAKRKQFDPRMDLGGAYLDGHKTVTDTRNRASEHAEDAASRSQERSDRSTFEANKNTHELNRMNFQAHMEEYKSELQDWMRNGRKNGDPKPVKPQISYT